MNQKIIQYTDWGEASEAYDQILEFIKDKDLTKINEAQTRFDVIDRMFREVLGWKHGYIDVEEYAEGEKTGYIDYTLRLNDWTIVAEAKKYGSTFPSPTKKTKLKLNGSILSNGEISKAIKQVNEYSILKKANISLVTNGECWCFYSMENNNENDYATILFPFSDPTHAEKLFNYLSYSAVEAGKCSNITNSLFHIENRLISVTKDSDARVDRNNIADHITIALNNALYADALTHNVDALDKCFVTTEARTKFDSLLGMHISDPKPSTVHPAQRIKTGKEHGALDQVIKHSKSGYSPPVTLIIGPVGAGKSTYLKHFEALSGKRVLEQLKAHWIYIDFEEMGREGSPREFLYRKLRDYLLADHPQNPTDFENLIKPAYDDEISGLARGHLSLIFTNKEEFNREIALHIKNDFDAVEPYVDKLLSYLSSKTVCIVVLDNVDLYEDEHLETTVFSEGLALSKRVHCNVIVSLRDRTYVRHRTDSSFDAYELRKLWLDPPPFRTVLSSRLTYSRKILQGKSAQIYLSNGIMLKVDDLSVFFDIVQRSTLQGSAGEYIECVSDLNIRKGLNLITNFLTSGHIQADRAISSYLKGNTRYYFPFHEIFKGTMLGQWRHYKEDRSDCLNLFDSRLGYHKTRLLRMHILMHLTFCARHRESIEVSVEDCILLFSKTGASEENIITTMKYLQKNALIRSTSANEIDNFETVVATRSGGYYAKTLSHSFPYIEACMLDTSIDDLDTWNELSELTSRIENESGNIVNRMRLRSDRLKLFLDYLLNIENAAMDQLHNHEHIRAIPSIQNESLQEAQLAIEKSKRNYSH